MDNRLLSFSLKGWCNSLPPASICFIPSHGPRHSLWAMAVFACSSAVYLLFCPWNGVSGNVSVHKVYSTDAYLSLFYVRPVPWAVNSEIFPLYARGAGNSISTFTNWAFNLLVSITFLSLIEYISAPVTFFYYAGIALLALEVSLFCLGLKRGTMSGHTLSD